MKKTAVIILVALLAFSAAGPAQENKSPDNEAPATGVEKTSIGAQIGLVLPVWVVGSYDKDGKANMMTAAWVGACCSKPPCVSVSLRKATYTHRNITERKAFTVNIPPADRVKETDYFGLVSGRDADKLAVAGLTPVKGDLVDAPYIKEFPVSIECSLVNTVELGSHTMFIGEIKDVKAVLNGADGKSGQPHMLIFDSKNGFYYGLGKKTGQAFSIGKELIE